MAEQASQRTMIGLLHQQYRYYTVQLAHTHEALSKLYKKLSKIERSLAARKERELTRKDKKKLQWDRGMTKSKVRSLEIQQAYISEYIRQCNNFISSYDATSLPTPNIPWTTHPSPMSYPFSPYIHMRPIPWTAGSHEDRLTEPLDGSTQYWDLSMLRERHSSSTGTSADSGYHEPEVPGQLLSYGEVADPDHVYAHELFDASPVAMEVAPPSTKSSRSDIDDIPEIITSASPVRTGAERPMGLSRRRYSENAIQLIESGLGVPKNVCNASVPPSLKRAASEGPAVGASDGEDDSPGLA